MSVAVFEPSTFLNLLSMLSITFEALSVAVISTLTLLFSSLSNSLFTVLALSVALSFKFAVISISIFDFAIVSSFLPNFCNKKTAVLQPLLNSLFYNFYVLYSMVIHATVIFVFLRKHKV